MKIVWSWLLELCDLDRMPSVDDGARALTGAGLEIEGVTDLGAGFSGVVVAEVVGKRPHPAADKLSLVDVIVEKGGAATQVVCGAPNVPAPGRRVLWARPGATLPGGLTLSVKPVKGIDSPGMLCSEPELGVGDDAGGIIVLDEHDRTPLGAPAQQALGLADHVLEVNAPANRGDVLGHLGLARELCALLGGRVVVPADALEPDAELVASDLDAAALAAVAIAPDTRAGCPRYVARVIDGVTVAPSPRKLAARLRAVGVRPINNLVDVTNYVMFELGQPLHAFDHAHVAGARIEVRLARPGERMTTLDGVDRALEPGDLLICDGARPVALGGVMGGLDSEVTTATTRVLLEAAAFDARTIRRTARRLGLHSEASHRFERGVDPALPPLAAARAATLLARLGGGRIARGAVDVHPAPRAAAQVPLRVTRARAVTGVDLDAAACEDALTRLGCAVAATDGDALHVTVPTARADLAREIDLIEEILRLVGYDKVPATLPPLRAAPVSTADDRPDRARRALAAAGLAEAITFAFQARERGAALRLPAGDRRADPVALKNPMSADQAVLRTSLVPNLLAAVARNRNFGVPDVALFEVGSVFWRADRADGLCDEPVHACVALAGARPAWLGEARAWDVFDARGLAETLLGALSTGAVRLVAGSPAAPVEPYLHPGVSARIQLDGVDVGVLGEVHPETREAFGVEVPVFVAEIDLSKVGAAGAGAPVRQMRAIPRHPGAARDVSLLLDLAIPAARVRDVIDAAAQPLVEAVRVLEDYRGDNLPAGHKSMLWSIAYRAPDRTLTDAEVESAHEAIVARLCAELPAQRR